MLKSGAESERWLELLPNAKTSREVPKRLQKKKKKKKKKNR
jgi:hypothetical protein